MPKYWLIGMFPARSLGLTAIPALGAFRRQCGLSDLLRRADGVEGAAHDLAGAGAMGVFGQTVLEQFGIGQNDPELVVQEMEELGQFTVGTDPHVRCRHGRVRRDCADQFRRLAAEPAARRPARACP